MTYDEWEKEQEISPASPEAYYAEIAWNTAIKEMTRIIKAAEKAEPTKERLVILLQEELSTLDTGFL